MRIFLSCFQSDEQYDIPPYAHWERYFKKGIEEAGYECVEATGVDWAAGFAATDDEARAVWRERAWSQTIAQIERFQKQGKPVDLFLGYLYPEQVEPAAISKLQSMGVPCVNFFCDNVREFRRIPETYHCFDLHWVPEFKALKMYEEAGLEYVHAPMPCWISPELRTCEHPDTYGVTFIGSRDALREDLFAEALQLGAPIELRGTGWNEEKEAREGPPSWREKSPLQTIQNQIHFAKDQGLMAWVRRIWSRLRPERTEYDFEKAVRKRPNDREYIKIVQESTITLGVNRYPSYRYPLSDLDTYSRMRDLEAPMMGACYLTEWTEGLGQRYELGEEIETYRTAEELVEKIRALKANPEKRKRLRCNGQKRALTDHTVGASIKSISEHFGIRQ